MNTVLNKREGLVLAKIKVLAGDFIKNSNATIKDSWIIIPTEKHKFVGEKISLNEMAALEKKSEDKKQ